MCHRSEVTTGSTVRRSVAFPESRESPPAVPAVINRRMKTSHLLAAAFAALLVVACARTPQHAGTVEPRAFLKIGSLYRLTTTPAGDAAGLPGPIVKIRESGSGGWFRVECFMAIERDGKRMIVRRSESWINFSHVISATEEPPMDELSPRAS